MKTNSAVFLRKPTADDKSELIDAYSRSANLHQPWVFPPTDFDAFIAHEHRYLLCKENSNTIVGTFNLSNIVRGWFQSAYLGYEVFSPYQQHGYMFKGLQLIIAEAFSQLNLHRIEANIQPENIASIALVAKAGFLKEGFSPKYLRIGGEEWKDHERWTLINHHWKEEST